MQTGTPSSMSSPYWFYNNNNNNNNNSNDRVTMKRRLRTGQQRAGHEGRAFPSSTPRRTDPYLKDTHRRGRWQNGFNTDDDDDDGDEKQDEEDVVKGSADSDAGDAEGLVETMAATLEALLHRNGWRTATVLDVRLEQKHTEQGASLDREPDNDCGDEDGGARTAGRQPSVLVALGRAAVDVFRQRFCFMLLTILWCFYHAVFANSPLFVRAICTVLTAVYIGAALYRRVQMWRMGGRVPAIEFVFPIEGVKARELADIGRILKVLGPDFQWILAQEADRDPIADTDSGYYRQRYNSRYFGATTTPGTTTAAYCTSYGDEAVVTLVWSMSPASLVESKERRNGSPVRSGPDGAGKTTLIHWFKRLFWGGYWLAAPSSTLSLLCMIGFGVSLSGLLQHWQGYTAPHHGVVRVWNALLHDVGFFR